MQSVAVLDKWYLAKRLAEWFMHSDKYKLPAVVSMILESAWTRFLTGACRPSGVRVPTPRISRPRSASASWNYATAN